MVSSRLVAAGNIEVTSSGVQVPKYKVSTQSHHYDPRYSLYLGTLEPQSYILRGGPPYAYEPWQPQGGLGDVFGSVDCRAPPGVSLASPDTRSETQVQSQGLVALASAQSYLSNNEPVYTYMYLLIRIFLCLIHQRLPQERCRRHWLPLPWAMRNAGAEPRARSLVTLFWVALL